MSQIGQFHTCKPKFYMCPKGRCTDQKVTEEVIIDDEVMDSDIDVPVTDTEEESSIEEIIIKKKTSSNKRNAKKKPKLDSIKKIRSKRNK